MFKENASCLHCINKPTTAHETKPNTKDARAGELIVIYDRAG